MTDYERERNQLLHEMRTIRAKVRLGYVVTGERRTILKTLALLLKERYPNIRARKR